MQMFTGFEYLLIDAANAFGLDKELFDVRLDWANENFHNLEEMDEQADDYYLYNKAVSAIRKAQRGTPTGHLVGFDAICSGIQLLAVMTGCEISARATGLIDPNARSDAYTQCTQIMQQFIPSFQMNERKRVKNGVMCHFYGSYDEPVKEFGEGTEEHKAFLRAVNQLAPGAAKAREELRLLWNPTALFHKWQLPDGFVAKVKVMVECEKRIEVDELNSSFTYYYSQNECKDDGVSLIANVTHSVDGYIVRAIERRCNYDHNVVSQAYRLLLKEDEVRQKGESCEDPFNVSGRLDYYSDLFYNSKLADVVILPYIDKQSVKSLSDEHISKLLTIIEDMLQHKPFPVITVHDEFKCHANHMNSLRWHYKEILADLADSEIMADIMSQLVGSKGTYSKLTQGLGNKIREHANYHIC